MWRHQVECVGINKLQLAFCRIYYGSPSNLGKSRDQEETSGGQFKHPLMVKENWKVGFQEKFHHQSLYDQVLAGRQKTHNNNILTLLNTANTAMLTVSVLNLDNPGVKKKPFVCLFQDRQFQNPDKLLDSFKNLTCERQFWTKQMPKICVEALLHFRSKKYKTSNS